MAVFTLNLQERPFEAIKNGTKNIEVRANKPYSPISNMKPGDIVTFVKYGTCETLACVVIRVSLYRTVRELLISEGTTKTLSSGKNLEEGIKSIEAIPDYKEQIAINGVFAIVISVV